VLSWAFFIIVLDAILLFLLFQCGCVSTPALIALAGILASSVAIIIRTLAKIKAGTREKMAQELRQLRGENKELLERLAEIRQKQVEDRLGGNE